MKILLTICVCLFSTIGSFADSVKEKEIQAVEKQRFQAQVKGDFAVLEAVLGDDLIYNHSNGRQDTKASFIQSLREGKQTYESIDILEQQIKLYGKTAIVSGICQVKASNNGQFVNTKLRYTNAYIKKGKQWQMVVWQSLKLAN